MSVSALGRLHVLTDTTLQSTFSHLQLTQFAILAGVPVVQYREKRFDRSQHLAELQAILAAKTGTTTRVLINDYLPLALETHADGLHLGAQDEKPATAIKLLPKGSIIGATVHNETECLAANQLALSYVGIGPVFGTASKDVGLPALGLEGLARLCSISTHPVIAIGGITPHSIPEVLAAGAFGVAILSAFCAADSPIHAAEAFLHRLP